MYFPYPRNRCYQSLSLSATPAPIHHDLVKPRSPIIGGTPVRPDTYSFMVSLAITDGAKIKLCGGLLLDPDTVLTARQCIGSSNVLAKPIRVRAGSQVGLPIPTDTLGSRKQTKNLVSRSRSSTRNLDDGGSLVGVSSIELHPSEPPDMSAVRGDNKVDAAILMLDKKLSTGRQPDGGYVASATLPSLTRGRLSAKMPFLSRGWHAGTLTTAVGWYVLTLLSLSLSLSLSLYP